MAQPVNQICFFSVLALVTVAASSVHAQALNTPSPVERLSDVVQFGVPRDAKFVFCDNGDCPDRTKKHLYVPPPPVPAPVAMPAPQPLPLAELSPAKVLDPAPVRKPAKQKPKHKKSAIKYECKPVAAK